MGTSYRIKPLLSSNLPQGLLITGRFTLALNGSVGVVRPSAGSNPAQGAGLLYTVTQLPTAYGSTAANCYQVTLTEEYFKVVGTQVTYSPTFSLTLSSAAVLYSAQSSQYDPATRSFVIYLFTEGTANGGAGVSPIRTESLAVGEIVFQLLAIPTVSQSTT